MQAKLMRSMFYVKKKDLYEVLEKRPFLPEEDGDLSYNVGKIWGISFTFKEKLNIIINRLCPCNLRKKKGMMRIYDEGQ